MGGCWQNGEVDVWNIVVEKTTIFLMYWAASTGQIYYFWSCYLLVKRGSGQGGGDGLLLTFRNGVIIWVRVVVGL